MSLNFDMETLSVCGVAPSCWKCVLLLRPGKTCICGTKNSSIMQQYTEEFTVSPSLKKYGPIIPWAEMAHHCGLCGSANFSDDVLLGCSSNAYFACLRNPRCENVLHRWTICFQVFRGFENVPKPFCRTFPLKHNRSHSVFGQFASYRDEVLLFFSKSYAQLTS